MYFNLGRMEPLEAKRTESMMALQDSGLGE